MCGPAALPIAMLASTAFSAFGQMQQGNAQAAALRSQARQRRTIAELNSEQIRRRAAQIRGRQEALAGASGIDVNSFSSLDDLLQETAMNEAADVFNVIETADMEARNLEASASNVKSQAQSAAIGTVFQGLSGIAGSGFLGSMFSAPAAGPAGMYSGGTGTNPMTGLRFGGV